MLLWGAWSWLSVVFVGLGIQGRNRSSARSWGALPAVVAEAFRYAVRYSRGSRWLRSAVAVMVQTRAARWAAHSARAFQDHLLGRGGLVTR